MPTPLYTLRLPEATQLELARIANLYGSPSGRTTAAEILNTFASGDDERIFRLAEFLIAKIGGQMTWRFPRAGAALGAQPVKEAPKVRKRRKGAVRHAKRR